MNEDLYLQRLKSIREKYTSSNKGLIEANNADFSYRPTPNPEQTYARQRVEMTPTRARPTPAELNRTPISRVERSYSLADNNPMGGIEPKAYDPSQKRMENFTTFIRDLDQRIEEKERVLNSKVRFNDTGRQREREELEYDTMRTLNRYSSSKDVCKASNPVMPMHEAFSRVVPRDAYERSFAKREELEQRRGMCNQDI